MKRRDFITLLGGAAAAWPLAARAQQGRAARGIGVLTPFDETDPQIKSWLSKFESVLEQLGWINGHRVRMDIRWAAGNADRLQMFAKELVGLQPEVIFAATTSAAAALREVTRTIPVVFALVSDPVGEGFVASVPRPGGNMTGFSNVEPTMAGKWLELLAEADAGVRRAALMFNPDTATYAKSYVLPAFEVSARSLNVESVAGLVRSEAEIETLITSLGHEPRGGLVVLPDSFNTLHRAQIAPLAVRNHVPTVSNDDAFVRGGGLLSYGANIADEFRRAAVYVDRILRGAQANSLPIQYPTRYEIVLNGKTAKALGLDVPTSILLRADELIE